MRNAFSRMVVAVSSSIGSGTRRFVAMPGDGQDFLTTQLQKATAGTGRDRNRYNDTARNILRGHLDHEGTISSNERYVRVWDTDPKNAERLKKSQDYLGKYVIVTPKGLELYKHQKGDQVILRTLGKDTSEGRRLEIVSNKMSDHLAPILKDINEKPPVIVTLHSDEVSANPWRTDSEIAKRYINPDYISEIARKNAKIFFDTFIADNPKPMPLRLDSFSAGKRWNDMMLEELYKLLIKKMPEKEALAYFKQGRQVSLAVAPHYRDATNVQSIAFASKVQSITVVGIDDMATKYNEDFVQDISQREVYIKRDYCLVVVKNESGTLDYLIVLGSGTLPAMVDGKANMFAHSPAGYLQAMEKILPPEVMELLRNFHVLNEAEFKESLERIFNPRKSDVFIYEPTMSHKLTFVDIISPKTIRAKNMLMESWAKQLEAEELARETIKKAQEEAAKKTAEEKNAKPESKETALTPLSNPGGMHTALMTSKNLLRGNFQQAENDIRNKERVLAR